MKGFVATISIPKCPQKSALQIKCISRYEMPFRVQCGLHIEMRHGKIEKSNLFT